jgi:SAM-dependent methyltransferase
VPAFGFAKQPILNGAIRAMKFGGASNITAAPCSPRRAQRENQIMQSVESQVAALNSLRGALEQACGPFELSHKRFDETHELFEGSSNQQHLILEWLSDLICSHYANLDPLRILSVGCGSGILDNPLIKSVAAISKRVEYTGVDPNAVACRRFQDDFNNQEFSNIRLDLREQNVESLTSTDRFDIIHLVHSLYYFDDPADTLDGLLRLLAPDGEVVIVQAPEAELNQLAKCFWSHHAENGIWFSDCLADHLSQLRLAFSRERIHGEVDVARCFEADCPRGEMMLDFITQSDCRQLDDDILQLSLSYLRSISRPEKDSMLVAHPADVFVIARPRPQGECPKSAKASADRSPGANPQIDP